MESLITERLAIRGLISLLSLVILFHIMVFTGVVPYDMVWGGRLADKEQMLRFEFVSIVMNGLMLLVVILRAGILTWKINPLMVRVGLWLMFALFFLNTVGNLLSINSLEKVIFTPLTILLGIFSLRLALKSKSG